MKKSNLHNDQYQKHLDAIEEHKSLINDFHASETAYSAADLKASIEKIAISLEEYFKVIGLP